MEHQDSSSEPIEKFLCDLTNEKPRPFSIEELMSFTSNLEKKLGFGGFGDVYKGKLSNGVKIAVKVLKDNASEIMRKQFMAEVSTMGRTSHPNLIKLYGFCFDSNMKALVYEYMKNGSLDTLLFTDTIQIDWIKLYDIATEIANGLSYLHEHCRPRIIHYDIKPGNVLLDSNLSPKIIDFGMARHSNKDISQVEQSGFRGTSGCAAPEVGRGRQVTHKSDVYSYGMMLFEILRRKRNSVGPGWFPGEVGERVEKDELDKIIMVCGIEEKDKAKAEKLCLVALWCTQQKHLKRPDMSSVVKMLQGEISLPKPPNPFPFYDSSPESSMFGRRPLPKFSPAFNEGRPEESSRARAGDLTKITSVHSGSSSTSRPPSKIIPNNDLKREIRTGQNAPLQKEQIKQYFSPQGNLIGGSTRIDSHGALSHFSPALTEVRSFGNEACSESDFRGDMADALSLIPASVLRNLADKLYEKRKNAALEIEGIVKQLAVAGDHDRITAVINLLTTEFTYSPQANHRKGGLIGLAAATLGLTMEAAQYLEQIVPPVLNSFSDQDSRVRYYACEALYNIAKAVRGDFIVFFNQISDALCILSADSDANVQSAAHLLDRLVKDIVTESDQFSPYEENDQESKTIPANMEFNSSSTFKPLLKSNPVDPRRSGFNIDSQKERRLQVRDASGSTFVDQKGNTSIEKVAYTWEMLLETFPKKCPPGGKNSVVLYTSLDVMGDTNRVRSTFQNLQINYSLRDIRNPDYEEELKNLLGELELPALFVKGRYIGGTNEVQKLNKEGKLNILLAGATGSTFKAARGDPKGNGFEIDRIWEPPLESTPVDMKISSNTYTCEMLLEKFPKKCPPGGENSAVLYTSLEVMGDTNRVRSTFQNIRINYSMRDISNLAYEEELTELLGKVELPALFVQGRYIGGTNEVQKLNKEGKLKILFGGIPKY